MAVQRDQTRMPSGDSVRRARPHSNIRFREIGAGWTYSKEWFTTSKPQERINEHFEKTKIGRYAMGIYIQGILFVFAAIGLFFMLDRYSRPIVRSLLGGPLNGFYLQYLQSTTKREFDVASAADNYDRAWDGLVFQKVYELGVSRIPYSKRRQNLEYIRVATRPNLYRKLADELIKVLPKQYRNLEFQKKLACYICELLSNAKLDNHDAKSISSKPVPSGLLDK